MNPITDGVHNSLKLWGEEEEDGAVYTVYLKKVRYHHPDDLSDKVAHLEWETKQVRIIKAGTLKKLVESLSTDTGDLESTYMNIFLSTYRSFATPHQVLTAILDRYDEMLNDSSSLPVDIKNQHRRTLEKVLLVWLDMYPEDFYDPPQYLCLIKMQEFATKYTAGCALEMRTKHRLQKYKSQDFSGVGNNQSLNFCDEMNSLSLSNVSLNFFDIPDKEFALQLTYTDNELFKKLVPYQCLGSMWGRRDKTQNWNDSSSSVSATINQFNAVSWRVIGMILEDVSLKTTLRAKIITKWINISQELRLLKNFSSLKAITAALQSNPIHRLTKAWLAVPREKIEIFTELAEIFSEENNQTNARELLLKEGSAKFVNSVWTSKFFNRNSDKTIDKSCTMQGTIPYLGTFLTDLTMIDAAVPDLLPTSGLVNFDKKRREFAVLAQIKLLQSAANSYVIKMDEKFQAWFTSLPVYDDKESYERSCSIEPLDSIYQVKKHMFDNVKNSVFKWTHPKCDTTPTRTSNGFLCDKNSNHIISHLRNGIKMSKSCSNLSLSPLHTGSRQVTTSSPPVTDFYIIKVSLDDKSGDGNLYKSIMLLNRDRTRTVIKNAMLKFGLEGDPDEYALLQTTPEGEIIFPDSANVYYAVNCNHELKFLLRRRQKPPDRMRQRRLKT